MRKKKNWKKNKKTENKNENLEKEERIDEEEERKETEEDKMEAEDKKTEEVTPEEPCLSRKSSFRKKINIVAKKMPLLKSSILNRVRGNVDLGLKEDMPRLSASLEVLNENTEVVMRPKKSESTNNLLNRKQKSISCVDLSLSENLQNNLLVTKCPACQRYINFTNIAEGSCEDLSVAHFEEESDWNSSPSLTPVTSPADPFQRGIKRNSSFVKRMYQRFSWHGGSFREKNKYSDSEFGTDEASNGSLSRRCHYCGHHGADAGYRYYQQHSDLEARSRSLTHIDQIEQAVQAQGMLVKEMDTDYPNELLVPPDSAQVRRQNLSRSEATSTEYFTVSFEGQIEELPEELVAPSKTTTLLDQLTEVCNKRGIDINLSNVFLNCNKSPLPCLTFDSSWMGGHHIRIKVNDKVVTQITKKDKTFVTTSQVPLRKVSSSYRSGKTSRTYSASTEDSSSLEPGISNKGNKRWSGFFGMSKDTNKLETLVDLLNSYSKNGIPTSAERDTEEDFYKLEEDWREIVSEHSKLTDRHQQQQTAIWELVQTEYAYIKTLKVVNELFLSCLQNLQSNNLLQEIDQSKLFSNIVEIYNCNETFWCKHMYKMLQTARKSREPLSPDLLYDVFMEFSNLFKPYEVYCAEQSSCQNYCREKHQETDNEHFTAYLVWCETHKDCNRLKLMDILVKPMQRLTKYSLLLKAVLKHTENSTHRDSLIVMIRKVDMFVNNVNTSLKQKQDYEIMKQLSARIESYEVVETKDEEISNIVQKYSTLNLTDDIPNTNHKRALIYESDAKFKDVTTSSKLEVHCFLLTDMLLVTKLTKKLGDSKVNKVKIIRQPYVIDRLIIQEINRDTTSLACVYLTEYRTATTAFILSCNENKLIKNWSEAIKKTKALYTQLRQNPDAEDRSQLMTSSISISRQASGFNDEEEENIEESSNYRSHLGLLASRSPRGSSRGSRISSLAHSHSGSIEMTENISSLSSVSASRGVSVENSDVRGSSLSSDEGAPANLAPSPRAERLTSPRNERREGQRTSERNQTSPHPDKKSIYRKPNSRTCNTLTVQVPNLGQSLPNLTLASCPSTFSVPPTSLLLAPPKSSHTGLLSPTHRGVSYPPPSPPRGSLKRGFAISPRNPPLQKTCHISADLTRSASVATTEAEHKEEIVEPKHVGLQSKEQETNELQKHVGLQTIEHLLIEQLKDVALQTHESVEQSDPLVDHDVPEETSSLRKESLVALASDIACSLPLQPEPSTTEKPNTSEKSKQASSQTEEVAAETEELSPNVDDRCLHCGCSNTPKHKVELNRRLIRADNKRYLTAGTIEEIKKIESRDTKIHKRFSLNYGQEKPRGHGLSVAASVQSSSGVSSVGSSVEMLPSNSINSNDFCFDKVLDLVNKQIDDNDDFVPDLPVMPNIEAGARITESAQSDLELFENKVSEWRMFGFNLQNEANPLEHISSTYISSIDSSTLRPIEDNILQIVEETNFPETELSTDPKEAEDTENEPTNK